MSKKLEQIGHQFDALPREHRRYAGKEFLWGKMLEAAFGQRRQFEEALGTFPDWFSIGVRPYPDSAPGPDAISHPHLVLVEDCRRPSHDLGLPVGRRAGAFYKGLVDHAQTGSRLCALIGEGEFRRYVDLKGQTAIDAGWGVFFEQNPSVQLNVIYKQGAHPRRVCVGRHSDILQEKRGTWYVLRVPLATEKLR